MKEPPKDDRHIYATIIGLSALLCFALLLTGSFWLTVAIMAIGCLHAARYFPQVEEFITSDPLLVGLRRISPLIVLGIFGAVLLAQWLR
jgi:hypothetical protein